jgi:hypothetical protein
MTNATGRPLATPRSAGHTFLKSAPKGSPPMSRTAFAFVAAATAALGACAPTVKIEAPDKPIEINLNIKIDQEVRIRLDKDVEELIAENPDLF